MAQPGYPNWAALASLRTPALLRSLTRPTQTSSRHTFRHPTSPSTRSLRTLTLTLMTRTPSTLCTPSLSHSTRAGPASGRVRRAVCCTSTAGLPHQLCREYRREMLLPSGHGIETGLTDSIAIHGIHHSLEDVQVRRNA